MNEALRLTFPLLVGIVLGAFFFGGLWWTVRRGLASKRAALWFVGSLLLRMGVVVPGFYFVSNGDWQRMLAALLGFVLARFIVLRLTQQTTHLAQDAGHAP